ncbi:MAG: type IV secretion system DNA-binding domain-containing protein [Candidatus Dojkabacteria bacterium]|nr:type IV secretion system DNA-binding domain-containing protein [Candidatus Dojkabacteria bacterium]
MIQEVYAQSVNGSSSAGEGSTGLLLLFLVSALIVVSSAIGAWFAIKFLKKMRDRAYEKRSVKMVLLEIRVPHNNEVEINAMDQLFASLYGLSKGGKGLKKYFNVSDFISFEVVAFPETIRFYVCVPEDLRAMLEKQIHSSYPTADIRDSEEYNIFEETGKVAHATLTQDSEKYKPLRTYEELSVDLISSITNSVSKMIEGEGIAIQVIISPAGNKWRTTGKNFVNGLKKQSSDGENKSPVPEDIVGAVEKKCSKVGFFTDIRIVAVGRSQDSANRHVMNVVAALEPLKSQHGNSLVKKSAGKGKGKQFVRNFIYRIPKGENILNTEELATVYHFPNKNIQTPHIHWLLSKRAPASQEVPTKGLWLGQSIFRGISRDVCIKEDDRRKHMYVVGKTGMGKSYLLQSMALQDIMNGKGIAFLDPHGDPAEWLIERIPPERSEDVIYFNPGDTERPIGFNITDFFDEQDKHRIVNSFIGLMYKMFDPNRQGIVGPRFERAVRNAMLTTMSEKGNTLIEVMRILTDPQFVKRKLPMVKDDIVKRYWTDEIAQTSDFHKSEVLGYIVSKFDRFVTNKLMRNIIGQSESSFNVRKIMDEGKILIVNLSKGIVGEENSQFLGLLLVPKILSAAMSRADMPEEQRRDFYLYVDEFQNFATDDFSQILSEARKYRLNLIVGNQYISQIDERIRDAVFGNVGTIISFKVGVNDSQYLQNEFSPIFDQNDLINLEAVNAYVKLLVDGEYPPPFSLYTHLKNAPFGLPKADFEVAQTVKELSRLKYGRDVGIVETEIAQRAELGEEYNAKTPGMSGFGGGFPPPPAFNPAGPKMR